ncbi:MAG: glycosyltransferase family 39 protein, partial [Anaerolineales bacterium]|nr:glycosyltransferase family 39 protein [Anaerolineales bacterium]
MSLPIQFDHQDTSTRQSLGNPSLPIPRWELILIVLILAATLFTRFYILGVRVMSHDETSHVYFSWLLFQGKGYRHDPITHGPFQFHIIALSYFLFGDNDFTARIPAATLSVLTIVFLWYYRPILGRYGYLVGAFLLLISPYILYYGRYARNEGLIGFYAVVLWWGMLNYLNSRQTRYLIWVTIASVLHFISKETAFIYTAQALIYLALYLISELSRKPWRIASYRTLFLIILIVSLILLSLGAGIALIDRNSKADLQQTTPQVGQKSPTPPLPTATIVLIALAIIGVISCVFITIRGFSWSALLEIPAFDLAILVGTQVLPMLAPFPVKFLGRDPIDYSSTQNILFTGSFVIVLSLAAIGIGLAWRPKIWLINTTIFYSIFILFYSTIFTNGFGIFTGLVGSLGYWLDQHGVNRGSQPWYYYGFVQIPMYEYLPLIGVFFAILYYAWKSRSSPSKSPHTNLPTHSLRSPKQNLSQFDRLTFIFFLYWSITSLIAFSIAGEKMPWLTFHITLPMIILTAWAIGKVLEGINWNYFHRQRGWLLALIFLVFIVSLSMTFYLALGATPPFQGKELDQLQATTSFLSAMLFAILSGGYLYWSLRTIRILEAIKIFTATIFILLSVLTIHTSFLASFVNYDNATEYLVYAHSARGPKDILEQIEEISRRTTGGLAIRVAYDDETTYPYWWYLRNYPNQQYYGDSPTRELRNAPIILVGEKNYGKIEAVVGQAYHRYDFIRLWWPNQDYFDLTWQRIRDAISNPEMRQAIFEIWLNRDYTRYGQLTGKDMSLTNWYPSSRMGLYIRKDIVTSLWNYGSVPSEVNIPADPYEGKQAKTQADKIIGGTGTEPGFFQRPRDLAVAPDGTLYIVDTDNHRIQHLDNTGKVLHVWGTFGDATTGNAPGGTFNQPWGIAVDQLGFVYVADTWNHRIQKFTPEGQFVTQWGYFGQAETPTAFWGPRDIAIDAQNRLFISDTGNKRIVVFDSEGNFLTSYGRAGLLPGEFDEPVGLAFGPDGRLYVADTWNQRIQVFTIDEQLNFIFQNSWEIFGWYGQSLDNKPYLAVDQNNFVYATDPDGFRVLQFNSDGNFLQYWGESNQGVGIFS